jgi:hypothetical protein
MSVMLVSAPACTPYALCKGHLSLSSFHWGDPPVDAVLIGVCCCCCCCVCCCCTCQLAIDAGDESVYPGVVDMLSSQGRMKYLRPLYRCVNIGR